MSSCGAQALLVLDQMRQPQFTDLCRGGVPPRNGSSRGSAVKRVRPLSRDRRRPGRGSGDARNGRGPSVSASKIRAPATPLEASAAQSPGAATPRGLATTPEKVWPMDPDGLEPSTFAIGVRPGAARNSLWAREHRAAALQTASVGLNSKPPTGPLANAGLAPPPPQTEPSRPNHLGPGGFDLRANGRGDRS
jgi:hypothetical protein